MIAQPTSQVPATRTYQAGIAEWLTLGLYAALLLWAIPHHEPWADEAQAWQIARSLSLSHIFGLLSYEGHPALWYLILFALAKLHVSFVGMRYVTGVVAFAGTAILVIASPFPRFLKLILPFGFFLAFQYAIIARSYALAPLLLFLCAWYWEQRPRRPVAVALCLGLLANVAMHAAMISGGLAVAYAIDLFLERKRSNLTPRQLSSAAVLLLSLYAVSIWAAWPAKQASGAGLVVRPGAVSDQAIESQQSLLPPRYPPVEPLQKRSLRWILWETEKALTAGLTEGLIAPFWLAIVFWALISWKLWRTRRIHYLLPALFLVALSHVYAWFWHSGLMLPLVIALLWMTWPSSLPWRRQPLYEQLPVYMMVVIAIVQVSWAEFAFQFDYRHDYGSGLATAAFLKPYKASGATILAIGNDFLSVAVQPYFERKVFSNEPYVYYWWSTQNPARARYKELLVQKPDVVLLEWRFRDYPNGESVAALPLAQQIASHGYSNTHTFCGGLVSPGREVREWDCDLIYQPR